MAKSEMIVINFPGGIISPGYLNEIMNIAASAQVFHVRFGNRQQLFLEVPLKYFQSFIDRCNDKEIRFSTDENAAPNIVSSYAAEGIFIADTWLSEGVYKDIFDMFDYAPKLKVNICDGGQTFVPFFNGNINWIASKHQHFWYLYLRLPKTDKLFRCPDLIYTNDIISVTREIEDSLIEQSDFFFHTDIFNGNSIYQKIKNIVRPISKPVEEELELPDFHLPYYEGFNKQGNSYWLGIYRRNELFPVSFLRDLSRICLETKLGEIYSTPWKALIIKGITATQRNLWDQLLGKYRINVRHAANELNWQVEDNNGDGLILKRHIIRYFDKEDVRTYGLCFAVKIISQTGIFGTVIIRKQLKEVGNRLKSMQRYEILYTSHFNPNSSDFILFRNNVEKEYLGPYLVSLCKMYYEYRSTTALSEVIRSTSPTVKSEPQQKIIHQCKHCLSVYDKATGDPENNIQAGTCFESLPHNYCCALCDSPKTDFIAVVNNAFLLNN